MEDSTSEEDIRKQVTKLAAVNERQKQEIHELKMKLNAVSVVEHEAMLQVEALQAELSKEKARMDHLTATHAKDSGSLNRQCAEKLENLEQKFLKEKSVYECKILKLEAKIAEMENISVLDSTATVLELQNLKSKNEELVELIHCLEEKFAQERHQTTSLESLVNNLTSELEVAKSNFEQKKEELTSAQEIVYTAQGEVAELKLEVEKLMAEDASHLKRGNSLFAEVEDRRKVLQAHLDSARTKLRELKVSLRNKDTEISKLRAEKSHLCFQFKSLEKECKLVDTQWHSAYTQRIQELEKMVVELREARGAIQPPAPASGDDVVVDLKWAQRLVDAKQAEVRRLESALHAKSVECLLGADCLRQARRALQASKAELLSARATIVDLRLGLLAADPGADVGSKEICDTSLTGAQSAGTSTKDKENVISAVTQKSSLATFDLVARPNWASAGKTSVSARKQELSDVTAATLNAGPDPEAINFPVI